MSTFAGNYERNNEITCFYSGMNIHPR